MRLLTRSTGMVSGLHFGGTRLVAKLTSRSLRSSIHLLVIGAGVILASQGCATTPAAKAPSVATPVSESVQEALAQFNRGAALLEQCKYVEAAGAFEQVLEVAPGWTPARFNLGLACLNMQEEADAQENLTRAKNAFESILREGPGQLSARFCLGLYSQHVGDGAKALECFRTVHQADPADPHVAYKYAEALVSQDERVAAARILERVIERDPGFVSAIYRLAMIYQRDGRREDAAALFARFRELQNVELTGGTFAVLSAYGTIGKYSMVLGADSLPLRSPQAPPQRVLFSPQLKQLSDRSFTWKAPQVGVNLPGIAAGDVDGDGDIDLCICAQDSSSLPN